MTRERHLAPIPMGIFWGALISGWFFFTVLTTFIACIPFGLIEGLTWDDVTLRLIASIARHFALYSLLFFPVGFMWGLGIGYGHRPNDKTGVVIIWIFAVGIMVTTSAALFIFGKEFFPEIRSLTDIAMYAVVWIVPLLLLACISFSKRSEIIKMASGKTPGQM